MAFLLLMGINEVLKSQGITSDAQTAVLDPTGLLIDKVVINPYLRQQEAQQEADAYREYGNYSRDQRRAISDSMIEHQRAEAEESARIKEVERKKKAYRVPAASKKLNESFQSAINNAKQVSQVVPQTNIQVPTRTTEQKIASNELQQKLKTLRAELQPAVGALPKRALPPSVPLRGGNQLLNRVMTEFEMSQKEAKKYIKKYGSN